MRIFDEFSFINEPDFQAIGVNIEKASRIIYESAVWPNSRVFDSNGLATLPSQSSVTSFVADKHGSYDGYLTMDFENYSWLGQPESKVQDQLEQFITMLQWIKAAAPLAKVGYYGMVPFHNPGRAQEIDAGTTRYTDWASSNELLQPLADVMDASFPSLYVNDSVDLAYHERVMRAYLIACNALGIPETFGYLLPVYNPSAGSKTGAPIEKTAFRTILDDADAAGYDGIVIWSPHQGEWSDSLPWYQATVEYLDSLPGTTLPKITVSPTNAVMGATVAVSWTGFPVEPGTFIEAFNVATGASAGIRWCSDCTSGGVPAGNGPAAGSCNWTFAAAGTYRFEGLNGTVIGNSTLTVQAATALPTITITPQSAEVGDLVDVAWANFPVNQGVYLSQDHNGVDTLRYKYTNGCSSGGIPPGASPASGSCSWDTTGYLPGDYTFNAWIDIPGTNSDTFIMTSGILSLVSPTLPINAPPVASNVRINGQPVVGQILTVEFDYSDAENDPQGEHLYQWLLDGVVVAGAGGPSYIIRSGDEEKIPSVKVTPVALTGASPGVPQSASTTPVQLPVDLQDLLIASTLPYTGYKVSTDSEATTGVILTPNGNFRSIDVRTPILGDGFYRLHYRVRNITDAYEEQVEIDTDFGSAYVIPVPIFNGWQTVDDWQGVLLFSTGTRRPIIRVSGGGNLQFDWIRLEFVRAL